MRSFNIKLCEMGHLICEFTGKNSAVWSGQKGLTDGGAFCDPGKMVKEENGRGGWEEEWRVTVCCDCGKLLLSSWLGPGDSCGSQASIDLGMWNQTAWGSNPSSPAF